MNVLVLPQIYTATAFTGISLVNYYLDMIASVNSVRDDIHWYIGVPESKEHVRWDDSDFDHLERVYPLPILPAGHWQGKVKDGFSGLYHPFFSPRMLKLFADPVFNMFDVVVSSYYTAQYMIPFQGAKSEMSFFMHPDVSPPGIVNFLSETGLDYRLNKLRTPLGEKLLAYSIANSDVTVTCSHADTVEARRLVRIHISPFDAKGVSIFDAHPVVDSKKVPVFDRPQDRCNFFFGGALSPAHRIDFVAEQVEKLQALAECKLVVTTQETRPPKWAEGRDSFVQIQYGTNREAFLNALQYGDAWVTLMPYWGTGLAMTESVLSGMIPIYRKYPWNEGRFPNDYVFRCGNDKDIVWAMHLAATDPEKFKELGQPAVDYVRKLHTPQNHGAAWSKLIARAEAERNLRTYQRCHKHTIYKLVEGALTDLLGQRHKLPEVIDILVGHMRSKNPRQMLSAIRPQVRAICRSLGVQVVGKYQFDNYVRCVDER